MENPNKQLLLIERILLFANQPGYLTTTKILFVLVVEDEAVNPEFQWNVDSEIKALLVSDTLIPCLVSLKAKISIDRPLLRIIFSPSIRSRFIGCTLKIP